MKKSILWVGLDVHAVDIAVACAEGDGPVQSLGKIPSDTNSVRKLFRRLGRKGLSIRACYEAGPCGYVLFRDLRELGIQCQVVAPTLIPQRPGDRVKTDKRDAKRLAELLRAGQLTPVWVPDPQHESLRDLIRAREAAIKDRTRARNRLDKLMLRHGRRWKEKGKKWGKAHLQWLGAQQFEHQATTAAFCDLKREVDRGTERVLALETELQLVIPTLPEPAQRMIAALQGLRGVALLTAATIFAEVGDLTRFATAPQLMAYAGLVPSEHSSGARVSRGRITKTGNAHLRRVIGEASWHYGRKPTVGAPLRRRQAGLSQEIVALSWRAQHRLYRRYSSLTTRGKDKRKVAVAVGRELLGFVWAVGQQVDREMRQRNCA